MTDTLETLAEKAEAMAAEHRRVPSLDMVRAALNEAGVRKARSAMRDAPDVLANAQETLRSTQAVEAAAKEAYDAALAEASWELDDNFVVEGAKTYLTAECSSCSGTGTVFAVDQTGVVDGSGSERMVLCDACNGNGSTRRAMTADQRRAWVAAQAAKQPAVTMVAAALSNAAAETAAARDSVEVARLRCSVARHEVDAAVAELEALVVGIPR